MSDFDLAKHRAAEAAFLLENPLLRAALDKIEKHTWSAWKQTKSGDTEKREQLWARYTGLMDFRRELTSTIMAGKIAANDLERQQIGGLHVPTSGSDGQPAPQPLGRTLAEQYSR